MPDCRYCSFSGETETDLRAHLYDAHELAELSRIDTKRVKQYRSRNELAETTQSETDADAADNGQRPVIDRTHESIISTGRWEFDDVSELSTDEILAHLSELDIEITDDGFREQARAIGSAEDLADRWIDASDIDVFGYDDDFVWMAAIVLWKRWTPEVPAREPVDEFVDHGPDDSTH